MAGGGRQDRFAWVMHLPGFPAAGTVLASQQLKNKFCKSLTIGLTIPTLTVRSGSAYAGTVCRTGGLAFVVA